RCRPDWSFGAIRGQTEHFRAKAARKCLVSPRIAAWADSETPPPGFAVPRHSTNSRSNFFTPSCPRIAARADSETLRAKGGAEISSVTALQPVHYTLEDHFERQLADSGIVRRADAAEAGA